MLLQKIKTYALRFGAGGLLALGLSFLGGANAEAASLSITGDVGQGASGVANVSITATDPGGQTVDFGPSVTAADGSYQLDVDPGTYDLHFIPPAGSGFAPFEYSNFTLFTDQVLNVALTPITHTLSGVVTDASGNPIPDLNVFMNGPTYKSTSTDSAGHYSADGLPSGNYSLGFGGQYLGALPGSASYSFGVVNPVALNDSDANVTKDVQLPVSIALVTVKLRDLSNNPITGTNINLQASPSTSNPDYTFAGGSGVATTDASGNAVVPVLAGYGYNLTFNNSFGSYSDDIGVVTGSIDITVVQQIQTTHTLSGTITDSTGAPIAGLDVFVNGPAYRSATTDDNGRYSADGLPSGSYNLGFGGQYLGTLPGSLTYSYGVVNPVTVNDSDGNITQDVQLPVQIALVTVNLKDLAGNPISGTSIALQAGSTSDNPDFSFGGAVGSATTDSSGKAVVPVITSYAYNLHFTNSYGSYSTDLGLVSGDSGVTVVQQVQITHSLSGVVTDASGNPIPDVNIFINGPASDSARTDSAGHYSADGLPSGNYSIGFGTQYLGALPGSLSYSYNATDLTALNDSDGNVTKNVQLPVSIVLVTVSLRDLSNSPVPGTDIRLQASPSSSNPDYAFAGGSGVATTDGSGNAIVPVLSSYSYNLNFSNNLGSYSEDIGVVNTNKQLAILQVCSNDCPPTGLVAFNNPTNTSPKLQWLSSSTAVSYNVYRDGVKIDTSALAVYADASAAEGMHTYAVSAVDASGTESAKSNAVSVLLDTTGPTVISVAASPNIINQNQSSTLAATFSSDPTSIAGAEYFEGSDPGPGSATAMTINGQTATAVLSGLAPGVHILKVRGKDGAGNWGATSSATVSVKLAAPVIQAKSPTNLVSLSWAPIAGANHYDVYRDGSVSPVASPTSGSFTDNGLSAEGAHTYYVVAVSSGGVGSDPSNSINVVLDKTAPVVAGLNWSANPLVQGQTTLLSATVTDNLANNIQQVTYTIDGGTPQVMTYDSIMATWKSALFGSNLAVNTYNISVVATDKAGNLSTSKMDVLAVYNTGNGYVSGHDWVSPSANDTMPIALDTSHNPAQLVVGFVGNSNSSITTSADFHYVIKQNQNEFDFSSQTLDWVVIPDNSHASLMIHGDLTKYVNGVKTVVQNAAVRIDVALGTNAGDQVTIQIWNPGLDPNNSSATYVINDVSDPSYSHIVIHK